MKLSAVVEGEVEVGKLRRMGGCKTALEIWKAGLGNRLARQHRGPGKGWGP